MVEVRCKKCGKLLGFFSGKGQIKCPRSGCGYMNEFDVSGQKVPAPKRKMSMKNRTTSSGMTLH